MITKLGWSGLFALLFPLEAQAQYEDWEAAEESMESSPRAEEETVEAAEAEEPAPEQEEATEEPTGLAGTFVVWGEVATFFGTFDVQAETATGRLDGFALSPVVGGGWYVTDWIRVGAEWGLSMVAHSAIEGTVMEDGGAAFGLGNALLEAELVGRTDALRHRVGLGVTLPFASTDSVSELGALYLAAGMRGAWDVWLWAPERLSLIATGSVETDLGERVVAAADAGAGVLFYAGDRGGETVFAAQLAGNVEYRLDSIAIGGRLAAVLADEVLPDRKSFQLSVMPYGRVALGEAAFLSAGFHVNLMAPYGFSFAEAKVWGLRIGVGTQL